MRLREQELVLLDQLLVLSHRLDVVAGVVDHPLRAQWRHHERGRNDDRAGRKSDSLHCAPPCWPAYAGSSKSFVRYTFTRKPSRIVIVGRTLRYRSSTRLVDCARLAPAAWRYASPNV